MTQLSCILPSQQPDQRAVHNITAYKNSEANDDLQAHQQAWDEHIVQPVPKLSAESVGFQTSNGTVTKTFPKKKR